MATTNHIDGGSGRTGLNPARPSVQSARPARRTSRTRRGLTYMDALVGLAILTLALIGMASMMATLARMSENHQKESVSYVLARLNIERIKDLGFPYSPEGTRTYYYDGFGANEATSAQTNSMYKVVTVIASSKTRTTSTGVIAPASDAIRKVSVTVTDYPGGAILQEWATFLTRGGI